MHTGRLDRLREKVASNEKRAIYDPARIESDKAKNKEKLNENLNQVKNYLESIKIDLRNLGKIGRNKIFKEAIEVYLSYKQESDKLYQELKILKDTIEEAKTDKYNIKSESEEAELKFLIGKLGNEKHKRDDIKKMQERLERLQQGDKQQMPWNNKLDCLKEKISNLEQIINDTSKLSDSQVGHSKGKVKSESTQESSNLGQGNLEGLKAQLNHLREVNSFIYRYRRIEKVSQVARSAKYDKSKKSSHSSSMNFLDSGLANSKVNNHPQSQTGETSKVGQCISPDFLASSQKAAVEKADHPLEVSSLPDGRHVQDTTWQDLWMVLSDATEKVSSQKAAAAKTDRLDELRPEVSSSSNDQLSQTTLLFTGRPWAKAAWEGQREPDHQPICWSQPMMEALV